MCCDPASSCDLLKEADCSEGERRHLRPHALLFLLLRPSALLVAVGDAGDQPRRRSARSSSGSDTSCCVGSLGVASGSALPSCLLEYNCLLLIFFFLIFFSLILWNSYPTQIPSQSCNLGSRRKSRTDQLPVSSVYYESVPMPCVILIFFFFFHLIRQHIKESDCAGEVCALSREGSVPAEMLPALSSTKVTANLSPCAVPPPHHTRYSVLPVLYGRASDLSCRARCGRNPSAAMSRESPSGAAAHACLGTCARCE